jgi:two-component system chemotaxis response regulator CheB
VAIGTSAGGVQALMLLARRFPPDFPAAILVTLHLPSDARSSLDELLSRAGPLPAVFAAEGDALKKAHIYIAPPKRHLLVDGDHLSLGLGPRENNARPAIDPMLRSTAACCGPRTIGVVLTGTLGDGASGLWAVGQCGGITVVQDPSDAAFSEMPLTAMSRSPPDHLVKLANLPALLETLVHQPVGQPVPVPDRIRIEVQIARDGGGSMQKMDQIGRRSVLTCPECNGVMWEIDENGDHHYRCHVGHAYSAEMMSLAVNDNLRRALGSALRALDERIALTEKLRRQASERGHNQSTATWTERKQEYESEAEVIRQAIKRADEIAARAA